MRVRASNDVREIVVLVITTWQATTPFRVTSQIHVAQTYSTLIFRISPLSFSLFECIVKRLELLDGCRQLAAFSSR